MDYIITTEQRSAFSEAASFREILLVATKKKDILHSHKCLFVNLKRLPIDSSDSEFFAEEIDSAKRNNEEIDDLDLSTQFVYQKELKKSTGNWFEKAFVSKGPSLLDLCLEENPERFERKYNKRN